MSIEGFKKSWWLNGPACLQTDEEKWRKPWYKVNEAEAEQVTSTVATETVLDRLIKWRRYNSFIRIGNFIACCMRLKTKQAEGKLKHLNLDYNAKHPIFLTAKHPAVQLLSEKAHRDNLNEGTEYVRNMLQQEFWIIGFRNALRIIKSRCNKCRHRNANPIHPPMADLTRERLDEHVFPFTHTGVDYFGPFEVNSLRRTLQRCCCLFTCQTTRAVHIEVAQSLDTESCLTAVKIFIWRRGYPSNIISDRLRWSSQWVVSIHD